MRRFYDIILPLLIPVAAKWAEWQERRILRLGSPLSPAALEDAKRMGVKAPERIRIMEVERIPFFNGPLVTLASRFLPAVSASTAGLSLRYGIYLRKSIAGNRRLLAHECAHTAQYERSGGIEEFLERYLTECFELGYSASPLEREAVEKASVINI